MIGSDPSLRGLLPNVRCSALADLIVLTSVSEVRRDQVHMVTAFMPLGSGGHPASSGWAVIYFRRAGDGKSAWDLGIIDAICRRTPRCGFSVWVICFIGISLLPRWRAYATDSEAIPTYEAR